ncbi:MAG: alpha/beta hydrolase [Nakamurella sp.]
MNAKHGHVRGAARVVLVGGLVVGVILIAVGVGFGATVGVALLTARPAVFLAVGLLVTAAVSAAGSWLALRRLPRPRRVRASLFGAGVVAVVTFVAVSVPLPGTREAPSPVPNQADWQLDTGSRLAYVKLPGAAPARPTPIIVLHGGPGIPDMAGDSAYFGQLTDLGFDVYIYDQLGSGRSSRLPDPTGYGIERDAADLEQIRRTIGAEQMVLIGHSYGGALAAYYLAAHPDRVQKLVLSSPGPLDPADHSTARATAGLTTGARLRSYTAALAPRALLGYTLLQVNPAAAHAYLGDREADARNDVILTITEPALQCSPQQSTGPVRGSGFYAQQYPQSATAPPQPDIRPALTGLPTPTLIFKGSCDYLSWQSAIDYRQALPNSTLLYLGGAGHNTYQDQPAPVLAAIRSFLTGRPLPQASYPGDNAPKGYRGPP